MATAEHGSLEVEHDAEAQRYVLRRSGETIGLLEYRRDGDVLDVFDTRIFPGVRGEGLGGVLVRDALVDMREHDYTIEPSCWYVRSFIEANDEFSDLLAR